MADGHGGYRRPSQPAAVSGPSQLSQRTDGAPHKMTLTDQPYGGVQAFDQQQSAAPMAATAATHASNAPAPYAPAPFNAPSAMPDVPVTAGADAGAGPGMDALGFQSGNADLRASMGPYLPALMRMADSPTATQAFRLQVRELLARINGGGS